MNIIDEIRARARETPDHPALIADRSDSESDRVGYAELVRRVGIRADRLRAAGIVRGERVGLLARQGVDFIEHALGILAAGACLVPVSEDHVGEPFAEFVARAKLHASVDALRDEVTIERLTAASDLDASIEAAFRELEPAYLRFTSGTTHRRKGVVLGHATILARLAAANRALEIGPQDRVLWLLPMAHHFVVSILLYLRYGATILLPRGALARDILEIAERERATVSYASPYHYRVLGKDGSAARLDSLRLAISTAEGLRADVAERFRARFGFSISQALGIIEVGLPVVNTASAGKADALGRPLPDFEVWLRGDDGLPLEGTTSPERTGEICIRGPGMLDAYLEPWLPASRVLDPDGFRTGDQGWFDSDGDLHLAGRRVSRISMAGMKFFGEEVEAVLDAHPAVAESRVFAREHPGLGEIPVAEVVASDSSRPPSRQELIAHCRRSLPGYKVPRAFTLVSALPRTETGKLSRSADAAPAPGSDRSPPR